jgi:cell division septum initiation protein DivIVA
MADAKGTAIVDKLENEIDGSVGRAEKRKAEIDKMFRALTEVEQKLFTGQMDEANRILDELTAQKQQVDEMKRRLPQERRTRDDVLMPYLVARIALLLVLWKYARMHFQ